jgi:hypothetical protein
MKRPIIFFVEIVVGLFVGVFGAWLAAKTGIKLNSKANADVRVGWASQRSADAQERIADALNRVYVACSEKKNVCSSK